MVIASWWNPPNKDWVRSTDNSTRQHFSTTTVQPVTQVPATATASSTPIVDRTADSWSAVSAKTQCPKNIRALKNVSNCDNSESARTRLETIKAFHRNESTLNMYSRHRKIVFKEHSRTLKKHFEGYVELNWCENSKSHSEGQITSGHEKGLKDLKKHWLR